jgi:O-acetyl-ADP-ribose deacetylase (regulator of RNase III)
LAHQIGVKTIGIPAVGTGIAGFPIDQCAVVMARSLMRALAHGWTPDEVRFVLFGEAARRAFQAAFQEVYVPGSTRKATQ